MHFSWQTQVWNLKCVQKCQVWSLLFKQALLRVVKSDFMHPPASAPPLLVFSYFSSCFVFTHEPLTSWATMLCCSCGWFEDSVVWPCGSDRLTTSKSWCDCYNSPIKWCITSLFQELHQIMLWNFLWTTCACAVNDAFQAPWWIMAASGNLICEHQTQDSTARRTSLQYTTGTTCTPRSTTFAAKFRAVCTIWGRDNEPQTKGGCNHPAHYQPSPM